MKKFLVALLISSVCSMVYASAPVVPNLPDCFAPTGLTTTNITTNSATFNWTAAANALNYRVSWHVVGNPTFQTMLVAAPVTTFTASGLTPNTNYEWKVKSLCDGGGESDFSDLKPFTTLAAQGCVAPGYLSVTDITSTSAIVHWSAVPGALNYRVSWHVVGNPTFQTTLVAAPATSFTVTGLTPGTNYEWKVKSLCDGGGESDFSALQPFTTLGSSACEAPGDLSTTNITSNSATCNWSAIAAAASYRVNWRVVGNPNWQTTLVIAPTTSYTITNLTPGTNYEWEVRTLCIGGGESPFSSIETFTTLGSAPACTAPTGLTTTNITANSAKFSWTAVSGALNYRVSWHVVGNPVFQTALVAAPTTMFTATGLTPNTNYEWKVKTLCDGGGESNFSDLKPFTTLAGGAPCTAPTGLFTSDITAHTAIFHWTAVPGAVNYRVNWHIVGSSVWQTALVPAPATSFTATGLQANTSYEWKVKTLCDGGGESDFSAPLAFTTLGQAPCSAPTGLSTTNITTNSATFNWTAVPGALKYRVSWHVVGNPVSQTALVTAPATSFTITGLLPNTSYEWKVKTLCDGGGESDFSPGLVFTTLAQAPCSAPTGLTTTNITTNSATFNWIAVPGAANYRVNWRVVGSSVFQTTLVAAPATSFTATGLLPNKTYEWKIRTLCTNGGESDFSPVLTFMTLGAPPCAVPSDLSTTNITTNSAVFHWNAVPGALNYRVSWHIVGNPVSQTVLVAAPATSFTATGLLPNTTYEWKVKTLCDGGGESDFSPGKVFTTLGQAPCTAPTGLSTTNVTANSATFNWTAVPGALKYRVNWHVVGSSVWQTALVFVPATSFTATGLSANTAYEWKVKTLCDGGGESDFSAVVLFTTLGPAPCTAPTGLSTTNITAHSAKFNWTAVPGALNYRVTWHVVGNSTTQTALIPAPATSYTVNGLLANTAYEWKVKSLCDGGGESDFSPGVVFTTLAQAPCAVPTGLSTSGITMNSATFNWTAVPGALNYRVNWHVVGNPTMQTMLVPAPATSFTATGLLPNTTYEWKVKTLCDGGGESDFSPGQTFTTLQQFSGPGGDNGKQQHGVGSLECRPNPADDLLDIRLQTSTTQALHLRLFDLNGKLLNRIDADSEKGENRFSMDVSKLDNGVYLLQVEGESGKEMLKVVVNH